MFSLLFFIVDVYYNMKKEKNRRLFYWHNITKLGQVNYILMITKSKLSYWC